MKQKQSSMTAFSLIELMIAMTFLVIGFFGYVALHARLLHSGQRLEERERIRSATDIYAALATGRAMLGDTKTPDGLLFQTVPAFPNVVEFHTAQPTNFDWITPLLSSGETTEGLDPLMELSPQVLMTPYAYTWEKR